MPEDKLKTEMRKLKLSTLREMAVELNQTLPKKASKSELIAIVHKAILKDIDPEGLVAMYLDAS